MDQKPSLPPKWDWIPCNYNLKTEIKKKVCIWNLQPQIVLTNPIEEQPDPHVKLYIDTEKSLQYSDELGWNWHKSWNLPNISVRLEIKDASTSESLLAPKNLYAHIFAVKAVIDQPDNFHLVDVGIRGTSKLELVNGQAFFTAIKFFSTSYNNEGVKFHLVLCIYIMNEDDDMPKILNATISPPIFVDSRKSARDSQIMLEKKMTSFVEPFLPENLDKSYIKRENKKKNDTEIKIYNNIEGLFNYLTAPNIRHKVKHPLFLCLKFSNCVKLFFNTNQLQNAKAEQIFETLQKRLTKEHCGNKPVLQMNGKHDDKMFILYVEEIQDNFKTKKIVEAIDPLQCQSLGIIYNLQNLPPFFEDICGNEAEKVNELISIYRKCYLSLLGAAKMIRSCEAEDYEDSDSNMQDLSSEDSEISEDNKNFNNKRLKQNPSEIQHEKNLESSKKKVQDDSQSESNTGSKDETNLKSAQKQEAQTDEKKSNQLNQQQQLQSQNQNQSQLNNMFKMMNNGMLNFQNLNYQQQQQMLQLFNQKASEPQVQDQRDPNQSKIAQNQIPQQTPQQQVFQNENQQQFQHQKPIQSDTLSQTSANNQAAANLNQNQISASHVLGGQQNIQNQPLTQPTQQHVSNQQQQQGSSNSSPKASNQQFSNQQQSNQQIYNQQQMMYGQYGNFSQNPQAAQMNPQNQQQFFQQMQQQLQQMQGGAENQGKLNYQNPQQIQNMMMQQQAKGQTKEGNLQQSSAQQYNQHHQQPSSHQNPQSNPSQSQQSQSQQQVYGQQQQSSLNPMSMNSSNLSNINMQFLQNLPVNQQQFLMQFQNHPLFSQMIQNPQLAYQIYQQQNLQGMPQGYMMEQVKSQQQGGSQSSQQQQQPQQQQNAQSMYYAQLYGQQALMNPQLLYQQDPQLFMQMMAQKQMMQQNPQKQSQQGMQNIHNLQQAQQGMPNMAYYNQMMNQNQYGNYQMMFPGAMGGQQYHAEDKKGNRDPVKAEENQHY